VSSEIDMALTFPTGFRARDGDLVVTTVTSSIVLMLEALVARPSTKGRARHYANSLARGSTLPLGDIPRTRNVRVPHDAYPGAGAWLIPYSLTADCATRSDLRLQIVISRCELDLVALGRQIQGVSALIRLTA
jgi:hypothetical protein